MSASENKTAVFAEVIIFFKADLYWEADKSTLGQNPTRTKAHWTRAHC